MTSAAQPVTDCTSDERRYPALPPLTIGIMTGLCAVKLLLHIFTSVRHYGYFRDELYYLDMARHLDWGYVDAAPLIALYAKIALWMGGSLAALRILPALAGAALVALTILIARELGGGRYAQFLAGLSLLLCPAVLWAGSLLTMNAFEPLFWMGCIGVVARLLRTGDSRLWLGFGLLAGLGLENKHSTLSFGFAVTVALLLTHHRREFARPWIWIAGAIALVLFLPNIVWQIRHHFPTIEDLANVRREGKNVVLGPLAFVKEQIIDMHPILLPVWLSGLVCCLRDRRWGVLGLTFAVFFVLMEVGHAKNYYVFPIYPMLLAGGAVVIEQWLGNRAAWTRAAVVAIIVLAALPAVPLVTWMLPPERLLAYQNALGFKPAKAEVHHESLLAQPVADQFGWPELVSEVAGIYNSLPPGRAFPDRYLGRQLRRSRRHQSVRTAIRPAPRLLSPPKPLVLGSAATGLQEPHRDPVEPRRRARQLHFVSGLRPLPALWHGRGKCANVPVSRCHLRHPEHLGALPPLELGELLCF